MKKTIFVFCMLMLAFVNSKAQQQVEPRQSAAPEKKNSVLVSGGAFMVSQRRNAKPIAEFSPAVYVQYNRTIWKGLGISIGYAYKRDDPNARTINHEKIPSTEQTHSILFAPNYRFDIKKFNFTPEFAMGVCHANFKLAHVPQGKIKDETTTFIISPGFRLGYDIDKWDVFLSYHYDYYQHDVGEPQFMRTANWDFPKSFGHHCLLVGAGVKF